MPKPKKELKVFLEEVKVVLSEKESKHRRTQLRIVHWIVDGKDTGPKLEKRELFKTKTGENKTGKCVGFNGDDIKNVVAHWDEISMFF